jgi:intracellular septation protein A
MKKKQNQKPYKLDNAVARRVTVVTLAYLLFMTVVWGTIARQFPNGIQPDWVLWLVITLSIVFYLASVVTVEYIYYKRSK